MIAQGHPCFLNNTKATSSFLFGASYLFKLKQFHIYQLVEEFRLNGVMKMIIQVTFVIEYIDFYTMVLYCTKRFEQAIKLVFHNLFIKLRHA